MSDPGEPSVDGSAAGMQNFRDLGGIATASGGRIRHGVLFRSDAPRIGDPAPRALGWPPATVIDLRSSEEAAGTHPLASSGSDIHAISLLEEASILGAAQRHRQSPAGLPELYRQAIANVGRPLATVARIVSASGGATLVHCTVGKDRTGLVVAVILSAVGVPQEEIVADYVRTEANMPRVLARLSDASRGDRGAELVEQIARENPDVLRAPAAAIDAALEALNAEGGAADWLARHGLARHELSRLRDRLVEHSI